MNAEQRVLNRKSERLKRAVYTLLIRTDPIVDACLSPLIRRRSRKGPNFNGIGAFDELRCWRRHGSDFAAVFAPASELTG
jgi:hypothetical protein